MAFWEGYVSDEVMSTFFPIAVYWLYAGYYQVIGTLPSIDKYRLRTRKELDDKNLVPLASVVTRVLFQQLVQVAVSSFIFWATASSENEKVVQPSIPVQIVQCIIAMLVLDTWQYFLHLYLHENKFLYRHFHSHHHRLVVPYAFGSIYNHPIEGLFMDTVGGSLSFLFSGMTVRTSVYFFIFTMLKSVDDHCGLLLPGNIFHLVFNNNAVYHDTHHQLKGLKSNYAQPFFSFWDKLLGTYVPYKLVKRPEGGFEARLMKD